MIEDAVNFVHVILILIPFTPLQHFVVRHDVLVGIFADLASKLVDLFFPVGSLLSGQVDSFNPGSMLFALVVWFW